MLRWRLSLGALIVVLLVGLCWLDHEADLPGAWLMPIAIVLTVLASQEILGLMRAGGLRPVGWTVYVGNVLIVLASWLPILMWRAAGNAPGVWLDSPVSILGGGVSWPLLALAAGVLLAFYAEMHRFEQPGGITANLGGAVLAMVYVGLMLSFVIRMRLGWGIGSVAALIIVVKMGDTGAYTVGRLIGRHKLSPKLSPGKTVEGAAGAMAFATLGAWVSFAWLVPVMAGGTFNPMPGWGWLVFGPLVGVAGLLGDLAESLLKRDAGQKDSSTWMPGFGGVLDILDSILLGAPVAYVLFAAELVGP
jgi:phosphatidate cytidylyltransferase